MTRNVVLLQRFRKLTLSFGLALFSIVVGFTLDRLLSDRNKDLVIDVLGTVSSGEAESGAALMSASTWSVVNEPMSLGVLLIAGTLTGVLATVIGWRGVRRGRNDYFIAAAICLGILGVLLNARFFRYGI